MVKKNRNILLLVIGTVLLGIILFKSFYNTDNQKNTNNPYGVTDGEIVAEFSDRDWTDIIIKEKQNMEFSSFVKNGKKMEIQKSLSRKAKYYFDYSARENVEGKNGETLEKAVREHLALLATSYKNLDEKPAHQPYYGVSIHAEIADLTVNGQLPTEIIEYNEGKNIFYIWYFEHILLDAKNIKVALK
ncbi:hypothetical protein [Enterococcus sp. LJL51]|uniref:hypothetical protein n=1 Tax=Enterococcus sp. LJL51 TaxID=3416656 RepID=UPI003CF3A65B